MAMFGGKRLPAPNAQDLADYREVLRRAGQMPDGAIFNDNPSYMQPATAPAPAPVPQMPAGMFANPGPSSIAPTSVPALDTGVGQIKPHAFDRGGTGDRIVRGLGDFSTTMLALRGNQGAQGLLDQQARQEQAARAQQEWARRFQLQQAAAMNKPQITSRPDGSIVAVNPYDQTVSEIAPAVQAPTTLEKQLELYRKLPEGPEKDIARAAIIGATNDPNFYNPKADAQMQRDIQVRQAPTYSDLNPPPSQRQGGTKGNPVPVSSREQLQALPRGTWVTLPNGTVVQRR